MSKINEEKKIKAAKYGLSSKNYASATGKT
jgi:hypothetical protein